MLEVCTILKKLILDPLHPHTHHVNLALVHEDPRTEEE